MYILYIYISQSEGTGTGKSVAAVASQADYLCLINEMGTMESP